MDPLLVDAGLLVLGTGVGWFIPRPSRSITGIILPKKVTQTLTRFIPSIEVPLYPYTVLPPVSPGQTITAIFLDKEGTEVAHRGMDAEMLGEFVQMPKGGPPTVEYKFSHLDQRGRFIFLFERNL